MLAARMPPPEQQMPMPAGDCAARSTPSAGAPCTRRRENAAITVRTIAVSTATYPMTFTHASTGRRRAPNQPMVGARGDPAAPAANPSDACCTTFSATSASAASGASSTTGASTVKRRVIHARFHHSTHTAASTSTLYSVTR